MVPKKLEYTVNIVFSLVIRVMSKQNLQMKDKHSREKVIQQNPAFKKMDFKKVRLFEKFSKSRICKKVLRSQQTSLSYSQLHICINNKTPLKLRRSHCMREYLDFFKGGFVNI